ncbi:MAG: hypothetical protein AB7N65_09080, partial [Vicinamibacterales bacterium]
SKRMASAAAKPTPLARMRALKLVAADFDGFKDVSAVLAQVEALERDPDIVAALQVEREDDEYEFQISSAIERLVRQLGWPERQHEAFQALKRNVATLQEAADALDDTIIRRIARRALAGLRASAQGIPHPEFRALMEAN